MFVTGKLFQPSLMFVNKAGANRVKHLLGAPLSGRLRPYPQNKTKLERPSRDKGSCLLRTIINLVCKKFLKIGPRQAVDYNKEMK